LRSLHGGRAERFGSTVLDCARIQDGNNQTGTANIVMHVHSMLAVIGCLGIFGGITVIMMLTADMPAMIVAVVMVAKVNMARLAMRVGVNDETRERADWSGQSLADSRRDCEDKRHQPHQVGIASDCSLQWDQHA
jgi:hypothetical protein